MRLLERMSKFCKFWYYQYILHTGLYMLESWERRLFTSLIVAFFAMASYTCYLFLPGHIAMLEHFLQVNIMGHRAEQTSHTSTVDATPSAANIDQS